MIPSVTSRRGFLRHSLALTAVAASASPSLSTPTATLSPTTASLDIGSRRELFVDRFLIERWENASLKLHEPHLAPAMTEPADPLEYGTIIRDGDRFRLYTREGRGAKHDGDQPEVTRYCESHDGIHWIKPNLGLHEINGSRANNVILHDPPLCHNFSPFLDHRPGVPEGERFKALAGVHAGGGLVAFTSADGIHWTKLRSQPVISSKEFAFDSQNVSFWSELEGCYVCYYRTWLMPDDKPFAWGPGLRRSVSRTTSTDFIHWSPPVALAPNFPGEHLYTTGTHPYFRAPHIYVALPTRFHPERGESTDILFMTAREMRPMTGPSVRPLFDPDWTRPDGVTARIMLP